MTQLKLTEVVAADQYNRNRATGAFIIIDRISNATVGAGMVESAIENKPGSIGHEFSEFELELNSLVRKHFPHWQAIDLSKLNT